MGCTRHTPIFVYLAAYPLALEVYRLLASGKVVQQDGRFYPRDLHESFHNSVEEPVENGHVFTTLSTDVPTKLWKTPPKYTVLDPLSPPLKEKKKT